MRVLELEFEDECYPVCLGVRCEDEIISRLCEFGASSYHFVTDATVGRLHAARLSEKISARASVSLWSVDNGEELKTLTSVGRLAKNMVEAGIDRNSILVSVGGGLVGNLTGLIAGLLFRGLRLVHIPTTLIAAADSVASLKQAVNLPLGKNLLGCFHRPTAVYIDIHFLNTLPVAQIRSGMCEVIKNALTVVTESIPWLASGLKPDGNYSDSELMAIIDSGLLAKQKVMKGDKYERKAALVFEYGHTVGHSIELASEGRVTHGEAIGLGMVVAAEVSSRLGHLSKKDRDLHHRLLARNGLTLRLPHGVTVASVMALLRTDNKRGYVSARADQVAMILLNGLGSPAGSVDKPLVLVDASLVRSCIEECLTRSNDIVAL